MYTPIQDVSAILFLTKFKLCTLASGRMTKVLVLALSVSELHITTTDNVTIDAVNTTRGFSSRLIRHNISTELNRTEIRCTHFIESNRYRSSSFTLHV